jgi:hypothetical protein
MGAPRVVTILLRMLVSRQLATDIALDVRGAMITFGVEF